MDVLVEWEILFTDLEPVTRRDLLRIGTKLVTNLKRERQKTRKLEGKVEELNGLLSRLEERYAGGCPASEREVYE